MNFPEVTIKKILYATDLSENARKAFAYAVSLADKYNAKITIIHTVLDSPDINNYLLGYVDKKKWDDIKQQQVQEAKDILIDKKKDIKLIKQALGFFYEDAKNSFDNQSFELDEVIVNRGNPVEQILNSAKEKDCDVIVMGSHGHHSLVDAMIGSTAMRVIRRAEKPVFIVRMNQDDIQQND